MTEMKSVSPTFHQGAEMIEVNLEGMMDQTPPSPSSTRTPTSNNASPLVPPRPLTIHQHSLEWHVQSFTVPGGKSILRNIAGATKTGELTAIMGPSGAGKTTLLECISLRLRNFEGSLRYDAKATTGEFFTISALVHQKELLFGFMTPREYLIFHALARMSHKHTKEQIYARVEEVLKEVKLEKCANVLIGGTDPIFLKKGISGGERKRLSIATELLLAPRVIFLDEPNSGLDSVMSESIFHTLNDLTSRGRMVMASVHSPSSDVCLLFTHLILLTCDGRLAYHGPSDKAIEYFSSIKRLAYHGPSDGGIEYFSSIKYHCPEHYNPADFYLKLVAPKPGSTIEEEVIRMDKLHAAYRQSEMCVKEPLPCDNFHKQYQDVYGRTTSLWTLFKINLWRALIQLKRDLVSFVLWGVVCCIIGGLFGVLFFRQATSTWRNLMGLIFSLVVTDMFIGSLGVLSRFPMDWPIIVREYYSGANAVAPYLVARFMAENAPMTYGPFIMVTIIYWMSGMEPTFSAFIKFAFTFISYNWACTSLGLYISSFSSNPLIAMTILPAFCSPMIMFSGVLIQRSTLPVWLGWLQNLSIVNYAFSALMKQQVHILPANQIQVVLDFIELNDYSTGFNVGIIWIINAILQLGTYINLSTRLRTQTSA